MERKKILIVDNSASARQTLKQILSDEYEVLETENGEQALAILLGHQGEISAVLLDAVAPGMDGCETLERIRGDERISDVPVIMSTDNTGGGTEAKALALGANDFIIKPFDPHIVKYRLRNIISAATGIEELRQEKERLKISEQQFRVAATSGDRMIARYDIKTGEYLSDEKAEFTGGYGETIENAPRTFIDKGVIAPESIADYLAFYDRIKRGDKTSIADISLLFGGEFRWFRSEATTFLDENGVPAHAIIVYTDITEQREKERAYRKWRQSLSVKSPDTYALFRGNLSRNSCFDSVEGGLLRVEFSSTATSFDAQTMEFAANHVHPDDRENYIATLSADTLLANYYRDKRIVALEFREIIEPNKARWLKLTIELVESPSSSDIEAYLMFEDVDDIKTKEIKAKELAETDPLTGVLNRTTFTQRLGEAIRNNKAAQHVLLMLDIDGFKLLNDVFGHAAGDQALIDITNSLRTVLRHGDLLGRLGGDEFAVFMRDIPYDAVIEKKARQICALVRKAYSIDVQISASIGVAVYPRDGESFEALYRNADSALYSVKNSGKDNFAYYSREMTGSMTSSKREYGETYRSIGITPRRRMLIVDDNAINQQYLAKIFEGDYMIEFANDGASALVRLRHYGASLSVVLLDLVMPGMDGFAVLDKMRASVELRSIPVIVVSGQDERETLLKAIKSGASDYVVKPVDPELIRLRVESAVSKAETERLRAQNSYLLLQSNEEAKYRTVLESTGTVVIEYDWVGGVFSYDPSISKHIAGNYDGRRLWHVLLTDMVADSFDVKAMQELVFNVANDRLSEDGSMTVTLKTPSGVKQWFRMRVFKRADEYQLTDKLIITYININDEVLANEKLRFQAERDSLTGLYNRTAFFQKAAEMINVRPPGYYVMGCFDIDNFKVINDQYGSEKGDEVLKFVARVFDKGFSKMGGITCRIIADTFAVLYPVSFMHSDSLAELRQTAVAFDGTLPIMSFSIGRYIIDDLSLSVSAMYDRAAIAEASIKGRYDVDVALYDESMRDRLLRQQEIVNEMRPALGEEQFEIWLQPQYNHDTGALIGAEALARWRHPVRGLMPPNDFIPVFERNGFVYELDKYVWEHTCMLLRKWIDEGRMPLPISVNISRYDVFRDDLIETITGYLKKYSLPPELLRLEITETAFAKSTEQIISVVKSLIALGFTVQIDDFGSGYSSLNTLKDVPAQVLKIDMRFLENNENSRRGGNILESIVRMAKWLNISVIAEGVETLVQADFLKSIGCNYVQGYLYAKPMPADEYEALENAANKEDKLLALETVENLDNNAFWDPKSMDALIFNTYVGGACIFEWHNDRIEILRANDKYATSIGGENCTRDDVLNLKWEEHMDEAAAAATTNAINQAIETGDDVTYEATYFDVLGSVGETHLRTTFRVIARTGDRYLLYATNENITAQRKAEQKERETFSQMQAIMSNVDSGVTAVVLRDDYVHFLFANDRYYEMLGYTREQYEAEVKNSFDIIHPEDRQRVIEAANKISETGESGVLEYRAIRRDGREIWERNVISVTRLAGIDAPVQLAVSSDITKEREIERRIRSLNESLQTMMNDTPGGFARLRISPSGEATTEYVNEEYCRLRGLTASEIMAKEPNEEFLTVHPDDAKQLFDMSAKLLETDEPQSLQFRMRHSSGAYIPLTMFTRVTQNEAGDKFINAYLADMSEREKRELSIKETLPYVLSAIMEFSNDLVFAKDKDYRYICCSPAFVNFTRQKSEMDVIGHTDYDFFTKEEADHFRRDDEQVINSGEPLVDYIEPIPSDDGVQHYCSTSKYILRDAAGEVIGLYGIGRDITESKNALERLTLLTNNIPGGLASYILSPDGIKITYFNDGFCNMMGYTREEYERISATGAMNLTHKDDVPMILERIDALVKHDTPLNCTYRICHRDGGYIWVNLRGTLGERHGDFSILNCVLFDVTEQKAAEEAERIHAEEMKLAMALMGKMICEYDPVTHVLTLPEHVAKRYGQPHKVPGVPHSVLELNLIDDAFAKAYLDFYDAISAGEKTGSVEYRDKWIDGSWHWTHVEFSSIFDADGKPVKAILSVEDVTQQHLEYELEQNRPMLGEENLLVHALFNLSTGETLDYSYANGREVPPEERLVFAQSESALYKTIINAEEREQYKKLNDTETLLTRFENGETELSLDYRRQLNDGSVIWVRNLLRMMKKPGGSDVLLFEYCYNIEEEKLRELMYGTLVNEGYDYVAQLNGKNGHFTAIANTRLKYGVPPRHGDDLDAAVRSLAENFVHPDDRKTLIESTCWAGLRKNLADKERYQYTFRFIAPDGEILYKKITAYYIDRERDIFLLSREDVTSVVREELSKNEQLSAALAEANSANQAKSQFLSRMSHDMRTPMNAIIGMVELAKDEQNPPATREYLDNIDTSSRFLLGLINDVLDLSKIESGKLKLNEEPLCLSEFAKGLGAVMQPLVKAKGIDFVMRVNCNKCVVAVDKLRFSQIFYNLLSNAIQYTPTGGRVELILDCASLKNGLRRVEFRVRDSGMGMSAEFLNEAFKPFSQGGAEAAGGTGLGLAIVKNIVEVMGGQIIVNSEPGEGSEFIVELFLRETEMARVSERADELDYSALDGLNVLLVEDNEINALVAERLLRRKGVVVSIARDGKEGVDMFSSSNTGHFAAILMDVRMPNMDGLDATRSIRSLDRADAATVPIIAMTADTFINDRDNALTSGMNAHLGKPIKPKLLYQTLISEINAAKA